jgi:hypothetical protein
MACGKRGDPLPPLRPVPAEITDLAVRRTPERVEISFSVPAANADGSTPPAVDRVEVYARTLPAGSPAPSAAALAADPSNVVVRLAVRPAAAGEPAAPATQPAAANPPAPAPGTPRPGEPTVIVDASPTLLTPRPLPGAAPPAAAADGPSAAGGSPTRYYVALGIAGTGRGRPGRASAVVAMPLDDLPPAPAGVSATYDERQVSLSWQPAAAGQRFRVLRTGPAFDAATAQPLTPEPLEDTSFGLPVEFDRQVCFSIQAVRVAAALTLEGVPSPPQCLVPADTYPPPPPQGLQTIQEADGITLIWTGVTAADLAGYVVLRGDPSAATLQPLFTAPLMATTYRDTTVQPGAMYAYAVYSVDRRTPPNASAPSDRQIVTVR